MRGMLENLPDGIHSGLTRQGAKGVFFYFTVATPLVGVPSPNVDARPPNAPRPSRQHFWRYIDLSGDSRGGRIEDNRFVITNLVQCQPDTPRVVPFDGEVNIFALQEKVIASIVQSSIEQAAIEEAPKLLDPIQQTIATVLSGYINSPAISRKEIIAAIQQLNAPQPGVYIKTLRKAYDAYLTNAHLAELLTAVQAIARDTDPPASVTTTESKNIVRREDLKLICFDYVW